MGSFHVPIDIGHLGGGSLTRFEALVDTGATYTSVPRDQLERLGVRSDEQWPFILADGREVAYDIAWVRIRIANRSQPTIAVFGDPGSDPLLGVVTPGHAGALCFPPRKTARMGMPLIRHRLARAVL